DTEMGGCNVSRVHTFPKALVAIALAGSIGLHWAFFQVVAWTGMVISYSQNATLTEAVAKTFDGQHPCKLCKQIAKTKQPEKKTDSKPELKKLEFSFARVSFILAAPSAFWEVRAANDAADLLSHAPAVPPPKSLQS